MKMKSKSLYLVVALMFAGASLFSQGLSYRLSARTDGGLLDTLGTGADTSVYLFPTTLKTIGTLSFQYQVVDTTVGNGVTGTYLVQTRLNSNAAWCASSNGNLPSVPVSPDKGTSTGTVLASTTNTVGSQYRLVCINSSSGSKSHSNRVFAYWIPVTIPLSND